MVNTCVKYHHCMSKGTSSGHCQDAWSIIIVFQKEMELSYRNGKMFEVQIWLWPFDPNSTEVLVWSTRVRHHCKSKGKGVIVQKPPFHRQMGRKTDGQTVRDETSIPHNFVGWGYRIWYAVSPQRAMGHTSPWLLIPWPKSKLVEVDFGLWPQHSYLIWFIF